MRSFVKIKYLRIGEITLSLSGIGKLRSCHEFFNVASMCFNTIRKK